MARIACRAGARRRGAWYFENADDRALSTLALAPGAVILNVRTEVARLIGRHVGEAMARDGASDQAYATGFAVGFADQVL